MIELSTIKPSADWAFADLKRTETMYASHGYHKYPAKFIPQIVQRLLQSYSSKGDTVLDPFGGCGTTLVEAKLKGRNGLSVDVNRVAILITKAKLHALEPEKLVSLNENLLQAFDRKKDFPNAYERAHPRLQYWFRPEEFNRLQSMYKIILKQKDAKTRNFYLCCFSNILKNCSIWYAKSIKPMRDEDKKIEEPLKAFNRHLRYMTQMNEEYRKLLEKNKDISDECKVIKGDARNLSIDKESVDLIITSPPYVTSYEYADLHQISMLWFEYTNDLREVKKSFVGTSTRERAKRNISSDIAMQTIEKFKEKRKALAKSISNYYLDLEKCYKEMYRVLKPSKKLCLILGDTEFLGIKVPNTEVSMELLESAGFKTKKVIKRQLSSKFFTHFRAKNGRFTNAAHSEKKIVYQYEYVLIAEKERK